MREPSFDGRPNEARLDFYRTTGSTNDDARDLALNGAAHGSAVAALEQTAGRGRRGHVWRSPEGGVYLSVVLRPPVSMRFFVGLPAVCSLGVLSAVREGLGVTDAALKWPNDIIRWGGKLGGLLVEGGSSDEGQFAVCGVGLNVSSVPQMSIAMPEGPDAPSMEPAFLFDSQIPDGVDYRLIARLVRDGIVSAVDEWARSVNSGGAAAGPLGPVLGPYCDAIELLGRPCRILDPSGRAMGVGTFAGIDAWGRATVLIPGTGEVTFAAEQASLRPL